MKTSRGSNRLRAAWRRWASNWWRPAAPHGKSIGSASSAPRSTKSRRAVRTCVDLMRRGQGGDGNQHAGSGRHQRFVFDSANCARTAAAILYDNGWRRRGGRSDAALKSSPLGIRALQDYHSNQASRLPIPWQLPDTPDLPPLLQFAPLPARIVQFIFECRKLQTSIASAAGIGPKRAVALHQRNIDSSLMHCSICPIAISICVSAIISRICDRRWMR